MAQKLLERLRPKGFGRALEKLVGQVVVRAAPSGHGEHAVVPELGPHHLAGKLQAKSRIAAAVYLRKQRLALDGRARVGKHSGKLAMLVGNEDRHLVVEQQPHGAGRE
jgi:hypothetical protein